MHLLESLDVGLFGFNSIPPQTLANVLIGINGKTINVSHYVLLKSNKTLKKERKTRKTDNGLNFET